MRGVNAVPVGRAVVRVPDVQLQRRSSSRQLRGQMSIERQTPRPPAACAPCLVTALVLLLATMSSAQSHQPPADWGPTSINLLGSDPIEPTGEGGGR